VRDVFDTNVIAVMRMCVEFSPLLIKAKGTILQIGSVAALM
jgi:1-acylglycerone phosphate reductase